LFALFAFVATGVLKKKNLPTPTPTPEAHAHASAHAPRPEEGAHKNKNKAQNKKQKTGANRPEEARGAPRRGHLVGLFDLFDFTL
jgi:hypothetical protein